MGKKIYIQHGACNVIKWNALLEYDIDTETHIEHKFDGTVVEHGNVYTLNDILKYFYQRKMLPLTKTQFENTIKAYTNPLLGYGSIIKCNSGEYMISNAGIKNLLINQKDGNRWSDCGLERTKTKNGNSLFSKKDIEKYMCQKITVVKNTFTND